MNSSVAELINANGKNRAKRKIHAALPEEFDNQRDGDDDDA